MNLVSGGFIQEGDFHKWRSFVCLLFQESMCCVCDGSVPSVVIRWPANVVLSQRCSCFVCVSM